MNYEEFYCSIDCNFPYHNNDKWKKVVSQSLSIGGDAPFLVLQEICRLPASENLEQSKHLDIYNYWKSSFSNPIQEIVEPACLALIKKEYLDDDIALEIMGKLRFSPKSYNALQVVYFASEDKKGLIDTIYEEIVNEWKNI